MRSPCGDSNLTMERSLSIRPPIGQYPSNMILSSARADGSAIAAAIATARKDRIRIDSSLVVGRADKLADPIRLASRRNVATDADSDAETTAGGPMSDSRHRFACVTAQLATAVAISLPSASLKRPSRNITVRPRLTTRASAVSRPGCAIAT